MRASHRNRFFARHGWTIAVVWMFTFIAARLLLDRDLDLAPWIKLCAALAPVVPMGLFLWSAVTGVRSLDELDRQVHLEALVIAYPLAILLLMTLGLLELAIDLPVEDFSFRHVWAYLVLFYLFGLAVAWRRYR